MQFSRNNTLVVFALKEEARDCFDEFRLLYCGVGKVNAAYRLTRALAAWEATHGTLPRLVLNMGSAGSAHYQKRTVVNCTHFIQRDFDISAFGLQPFATPFEDHLPATLNHGVSFGHLPTGTCGTGDTFVTNAQQGPWNVVDMEAYALAKICLLENIPFGCLKYISDGADGQAAGTWEESLDVTARCLFDVANDLFLP